MVEMHRAECRGALLARALGGPLFSQGYGQGSHFRSTACHRAALKSMTSDQCVQFFAKISVIVKSSECLLSQKLPLPLPTPIFGQINTSLR